MNVNRDPATPPDADIDSASAAAADGEAVPAKPVRRKRAVKTAAAEATVHAPIDSPVEAAGAAVTDAAQAPPEDAAPAAPAAKKTRRRKAVAADASEAPADAAPAAEAPVTEPVPPPPEPAAEAPARAVTPVMATAETAAQASAEPRADAPAPVERQSADMDGAETSERAEGASGEPVSGEPLAGEGGRSSRRRSRRERRRARQDAMGPDGVAAESVASDADDDGDEPRTDAADALPPEPPTNPDEVFAQVMSGAFDADGEPSADEPVAPPKRVLRPEPEAPKLHKVLAQAGVGSRRDMEQAIADGHVTVNGQPAHIGQRISFGDQIKVNGKPVRVRIVPPPPRIIAYHKPVGEVVTHDDPQHRPTVFRRLPRLPQGKWQSVGRLDLNTEGLLLFTNSGELANQLMHPRFGVEREYAVRVLGKLDEGDKAELTEGVDIDGQTCSFRSIQDGGGEGANHWYRVVITEGRNREVRKLFEAIDLTVSRLIRIRYGTVVLPRGLKRGVWVDLQDDDVRAIRRLASPDGEGRERNEGGRGDRGDRSDGGKGGRNNKQRNDRRNDGGQRPPRNARPADAQQRPPADDARPRDPDRDDDYEEIDHSRIPNPLEQTFDKRFVQNPRTSVGGRGFGRGGGGFGGGGSSNPPSAQKKGGPREPDPLQTSVGYIGADAFHRKGSRSNRGGGQGGGGFGRGGSGGGGGGHGGGGGRRGGGR